VEKRTAAEGDRWLAAFHAGERWAVELSYREHASRVLAAARGMLGTVDAETVTHEVWCRLLSSSKMREGFRGGNLGAWLVQVATHSAIDDLRRRRREVLEETPQPADTTGPADEELEAKLLIDRFRAEKLPPEWASVFEARFLRQLPQRDAARELGIPRSTLAYQEQRIRELLRHYLLEDEGPGGTSASSRRPR
jgi:RNA polymerase sigma-70 factor, ECF subfamily